MNPHQRRSVALEQLAVNRVKSAALAREEAMLLAEIAEATHLIVLEESQTLRSALTAKLDENPDNPDACHNVSD